MRAKRYFVSGDAHVLLKDNKVGGVDLLTNNAVVSFLEEEGPFDGYVNLGDAFDMNVISSHNLGNLRAVRGESVGGQYRAGNAYLTQHWKAAGKPTFHLIEGNHENRVERYINANPELEGLVDLDKNIPSFVKLTKFWTDHELLNIGKATFIHGINTGARQVSQALRDYGTNVFMGHTHRRELMSLRYYGPDSTKVAESLPCLCEYGQPYLKGRPTQWQQGFAVFYFYPNGNFNYYVTSIFDHAFISPTGKYYDGKKERPETKLILE